MKFNQPWGLDCSKNKINKKPKLAKFRDKNFYNSFGIVIADYFVETGTYQTLDGSKVADENSPETDHTTITAEPEG